MSGVLIHQRFIGLMATTVILIKSIERPKVCLENGKMERGKISQR